MNIKNYRLGLVFGIIALCVGCGGSGDGSDGDPAIVVIGPEQSALNAAEATWQNQSITSYQYIYNRFCFCPALEDQVIRVVNGQVVEAFFTPSGVPITGDELEALPVIEDLFAIIQEAIDDEADRLEVEYHPDLGYPESIFIDFSLMVSDDEFTYEATELQ